MVPVGVDIVFDRLRPAVPVATVMIMSLAAFKDLCIDAVDPEAMGRFWSVALGLELHHDNDGDVHLTGPTKAHTVWINRVPEPKAAKNRVHLDVHGRSVAELTDLGGTIVDGESFRWTVMTDVEGGEFCLFVRSDPPPYRLYELAFDCPDHRRSSQWWGDAIGGDRVVDDEHGFSYLENVPGLPCEAIVFVTVPEPKQTKNRVHMDLTAESIEPLISIGATLLRQQDDEIGWHVMADLDGNEFCVFTSAED